MKKKVLVSICACIGVGAFVLGLLHTEARVSSELEEQEPVPYARCFKACADSLGWDWELLAAVAWHESHFNPHARSHIGAAGVMQLVPKTAYSLGLNDSTIWVPEDNIRAGAAYIQLLQKQWSFIHNKEEQTKFVLASYNAGPGFIFAARRVVRDNGENSYVWANVEPYVEKAQARAYVHQVLRTANKYRELYSDWNKKETIN